MDDVLLDSGAFRPRGLLSCIHIRHVHYTSKEMAGTKPYFPNSSQILYGTQILPMVAKYTMQEMSPIWTF